MAFLSFLLIVHGLIHLLGFVKAFGFADVSQLTKNISQPAGAAWLLAALLFIASAIVFLLGKEWWGMIAIPALFVSQPLIFMSWQDAKFGTIANIVILVAVVLSLGSVFFESSFRNDVRELLSQTSSPSEELFLEEDLLPLPEPVQRYLRYVGVVSKPKVRNMRIVFTGQMRKKEGNFFPFTSVQYNFFDEPTRLFFMKAKIFGVPVSGYHKYRDAKATMDIRLFGLIPIVQEAGQILDKTETVTLFNDICLMAPAALIDKRIRWEDIDRHTVRAIFTNRGITITAQLFFNQEGQLTKFVSNDRTEINDMKQYPFSTPVSLYQNINGVNIMSAGEAVYEYPDGKFTYGRFALKNAEYNCK